ncbi:hypothetical protein C2E23DRAFT_487231 [Lenzites betulinus]|nr:hypothetical protein C2E23DRAFT_487231 [Lenzites betulinus]
MQTTRLPSARKRPFLSSRLCRSWSEVDTAHALIAPAGSPRCRRCYLQRPACSPRHPRYSLGVPQASFSGLRYPRVFLKYPEGIPRRPSAVSARDPIWDIHHDIISPFARFSPAASTGSISVPGVTSHDCGRKDIARCVRRRQSGRSSYAISISTVYNSQPRGRVRE